MLKHPSTTQTIGVLTVIRTHMTQIIVETKINLMWSLQMINTYDGDRNKAEGGSSNVFAYAAEQNIME